MVFIVIDVVIGFKVVKRTLIAQVFDIGDRGGDAGAKARMDGDGVVGGFGGPAEEERWWDWFQNNGTQVAPTPGVASVAGLGGTTTTTTNVSLGPFNITIPNVGGTPESAGREFARTVDQELRARGWAPT